MKKFHELDIPHSGFYAEGAGATFFGEYKKEELYKVVSFVVGIFILHGAYEIFKSTIKILVDGAIIEENVIREIVVEFKEIKDIKNIRSRGSENDIHIDMDIMVEPDMTVEKSHELSHSIENTMRAKINQNIQVATHIEPFKK